MTSGVIFQFYCAEDEIRIVLTSIVAKSLSKQIKAGASSSNRYSSIPMKTASSPQKEIALLDELKECV